jgi:hypothetical protein
MRSNNTYITHVKRITQILYKLYDTKQCLNKLSRDIVRDIVMNYN